MKCDILFHVEKKWLRGILCAYFMLRNIAGMETTGDYDNSEKKQQQQKNTLFWLCQSSGS